MGRKLNPIETLSRRDKTDVEYVREKKYHATETQIRSASGRSKYSVSTGLRSLGRMFLLIFRPSGTVMQKNQTFEK